MIFGIDPGFGNIKLFNDDGGTIYASHASQFTGKRYDNLMDEAKKADFIQFNGRAYFTGELAPLQGTPLGNLGFERLTDGAGEMKALLYGAFTRHMHEYGLITDSIDAQVGVPAAMLDAKSQDETLSGLRAWLVGNHEWTANGDDYRINIRSIDVKSQATGAILDFGLTLTGATDAAHAGDVKKDVGVVSIGYNTVELAAASGANTMLTNMVGSDTYGVRRLLEALDGGDKSRLGFIDYKLRENRFNGELAPARDAWGEQVKGYIGRYWGKEWRKLNRVIVVGGGATNDLLRRDLDLFFVGKTYFPDDPIISIARGLYKRGVAIANKKAK